MYFFFLFCREVEFVYLILPILLGHLIVLILKEFKLTIIFSFRI